jgi:hypothetical protein
MDGSQDAFTPEEICEQAKGNVGALSLLLLSYARDRGQSLDEAAGYFGRVFAPSWDEVPARDARTVARWAALNMVTGGAELRRLEGDARHAESVVARWPLDEDRGFFGLSQQEADYVLCAVHTHCRAAGACLHLETGRRRRHDDLHSGGLGAVVWRRSGPLTSIDHPATPQQVLKRVLGTGEVEPSHALAQ